MLLWFLGLTIIVTLVLVYFVLVKLFKVEEELNSDKNAANESSDVVKDDDQELLFDDEEEIEILDVYGKDE